MRKPLNEYVNLFPYPKDALTRFSFILGDVIAVSIMVLILYVTLKATLHF
jgi:hypothetical protein